MRKVLMIVAMSVMGLFALVAALFVIGETLTDPGGLKAVGLVALWLVPLVALALFAWWRPEAATMVLLGLSVVALGLVVWSALDPDPWRSFQDANGPVLAVGLFALAVPVAVLGWHRPLVGGGLLVGLGLVPLVSVLLLAVTGAFDDGPVPPQAGLGVMVSPLILVGALLLIAGTVSGEEKPAPPATPPGGPVTRPPRLA